MVLLEAVDQTGSAVIDADAFRRLVASWDAPPPAGLYSSSRYALEVQVRAADAGAALTAATSSWTTAVRRVGLPTWELVRAEAVTLDEYERDLLEAQLATSTEDSVGRAGPPPADAASDDLLQRALYDPVTGLPARELFLDEVRSALARGRPRSGVQTVMVVDVDGIEVGEPPAARPGQDEILVEVATRLRGAVRLGDVVARVGRARFALLVTLGGGDDTDVVASRIVDNVRSLILGDSPASPVTASVGVAAASSGGDADELLRLAELAVATAREAGGNRHARVGAHSDGG